MSFIEVPVASYIIKFDANPVYAEESADNFNLYDAIYVDDAKYRSISIYGISVFLDGDLLKRVLIKGSGGATTIHEKSFIIESDSLVICCSNAIFCLSVPDLLLLWKTKADDATCFEIFKYKSDYIVHGELAISRLSKDGDLIWQQGGADIFTTMNTAENDFIITDDCILATDWENRKYRFDFNGNIIE